MVYLKLHPYKQTTVSQGRTPKLSSKYYGPFKVLDKVGKVAYQLELPSTTQIHDIFHVSQLKKAVGTLENISSLPFSARGYKTVEPVAILERKMVKRGNRPEVQWLIHWKHLSPAEATWEFASKIRRRLPSFSP